MKLNHMPAILFDDASRPVYLSHMRNNKIEKNLGGVWMSINKDMTIGEIVRKYPEAIEILMSFGMGCVG